jgi:hypothetical protein
VHETYEIDSVIIIDMVVGEKGRGLQTVVETF